MGPRRNQGWGPLNDAVYQSQDLLDNVKSILLPLRYAELVIQKLCQLQAENKTTNANEGEIGLLSVTLSQDRLWSLTLLNNIPFIRERYEQVLKRTSSLQSSVRLYCSQSALDAYFFL
jgi:hypothetical protein